MAGEICGLDFGIVMSVGAARGVDVDMLSETLPVAEAAMLRSLGDGDGGGDEE